MAAALSLASCNNKTPPTTAAAAASQPKPGDDVRQALAAHNFGQAATLATKAVGTAPHDPALKLLQAEAEAQLGNGGNAARALDQAISAGLPDPQGAVRDPMFDPIRDDPNFRDVVDRLNRPQVSTSRGAGTPGSTVRAGDVEVRGDTVRAGDLVLEGNH